MPSVPTSSVMDQQPVAQPSPEFQRFLDDHLDQEMLRFTTAGSVDDGKSTLIGRLLHDTKSVYEDQLAAITKSRVNRATTGIDFSLLTDGLKAEREQGITIDVAYRYFSTSKRKFIIADTPGHEQYTRNMATGASTADVAIVLIDAAAFAKHGSLLPQSRRHTFIASLLRIPHVVAAVNKMDLVDYDEARFTAIRKEFLALAEHLGLKSVEVIPVSALAGDNIVNAGANMPWYSGPTLLQYLETVPVAKSMSGAPLRFPVQLVLRPDASFRGFAGQVASGVLHQGDTVLSLPSRQQTRVKAIVTFDGNLKTAINPMSVAVELEDEIDLSRGDMLVRPHELPHGVQHFEAKVVWMHEQPLSVGQTYLAKHTTRIVRAKVKAIRYRIDINSFAHVPARQLEMNDIAEVEFETSLPIFFDTYAENRLTGSMILIEPLTNATVGAVMIDRALEKASTGSRELPSFIHVPGRPELAQRLADEILARGERVVLLDDEHIAAAGFVAAIRAAELAGATAISASGSISQESWNSIRRFLAEESFFTAANLTKNDAEAAAHVLKEIGAQS
ncbi:MAG TPA: sulfate adenylyltransferase subunit CysN [Acidobacteriaceae bacterium]|nr:sulfate adenylyltransferase subunit CysN [Acidobacteriaceae bacterium]